MQHLFDWFIKDEEDGPHVKARPLTSNYDLDFDFGPVCDVLVDLDHGLIDERLTWRHFHNGNVWDKRAQGTDVWRAARAQKRAKDEVANAQVCNLWLAACGLRVRDDKTWRATSLNAVLHQQFGPGYTAATNGVDVLLVSGPWLTAEWMLVHRTNVIGPVTGSPVDVKDWNWLANCKSAQCGPKKPSQSRAALLERMLEEI